MCNTETNINGERIRGNIFKGKVDKVDNTDRKDLLRKKEKSNKNRILCLIAYNRKLPMFCKIINKCWNAL